jgi:type IV pilus assembly protein PilY1
MDIREICRVMGWWLLSLLGIAVTPGLHGAPLNLSNAPLFLRVSLDPYVFFMVDDSGSMRVNCLKCFNVPHNNSCLFRHCSCTGSCAKRYPAADMMVPCEDIYKVGPFVTKHFFASFPKSSKNICYGRNPVAEFTTPFIQKIIRFCILKYNVQKNSFINNLYGQKFQKNLETVYINTASCGRVYCSPYPRLLFSHVPRRLLDENTKWRMVAFTVTSGANNRLIDSESDDWPNPPLTENGNWNNPENAYPIEINALWHAVHSNQEVLQANKSPHKVVDSIQDALANIADRVGSSASVATNSGTLNAGSYLYQARFDSADWSGQLLAFAINEDGSVDPVPDWNAADVLDSQNYNTGREIITFNPLADVIPGGAPEGQGVAFRWPGSYQSPNALTELSTAQITRLLTNAPHPAATAIAAQITANQNFGQAITDYLRGQTTNEGIGYEFRVRNSVLGDIVNSDPRYVGAPSFRYPESVAPKSYAAFKTANANRDAMVYVGANDGMLHGFYEVTGAERIAYVPHAVFRNLYALARQDYFHRYYVDSGPNIVDAYLATMDDPSSKTDGLWRSVLVGGLGGGGQAVYALDVTDPDAFDEANAADLVLWEFDDTDDVDLGYTYGKPQIAKMANGRWAAVFGNGYNNTEADGNASSTGRAVLYVVDLETGVLIRKLNTNSGVAATPNGLATPTLVDYNGDLVVDLIYAGDLLGNVWKFDVTDANPAQWDSDYKSGANPRPLFTTTANQPITTQLQVTFHPDGLDGFMVYFGTGKYLEITDNQPLGQTTQAFYGIWDKNLASLTVFDSSDLVLQAINNQYLEKFDTDEDGSDDASYTLRELSDNDVDFASGMGWKLNLMPVQVEGAANASNFGERQVSNAVVRDGRVIFTTLIPSQSPCDFGGCSFVMQVNYRDGGALGFPAFDLNGDGVFDAVDTNASGRMSDVGIVPTLSILSDADRDVAFGSGSSGDVDVFELNTGTSATGRQSWRQLD